MKKKLGWTAVVVVCLAHLAGVALAQSAPQLINYQGRLTNALGQPLADGSTVDLTFKFYSAATGGTLYLTVLQQNVVVNNGLYNVLIGSGTVSHGTEISLANVFRNHSEVWLGVKVDAEAEMTPRSRIASVPYALACESSASIDFSAIARFISVPDYDDDGHDKEGIWVGDDCDDSEARVYQGAPEVCDGIDNQCPGDAGYGQVDEGCGACEDLDGDDRGWGCAAGPDCDDLDMNNWLSCATCTDYDGDGSFAECDDYVTVDGPDCDDLDLNNWLSCATCLDGDTDSYFAGCDAYLSILGPDCDNAHDTTYPGATETCRDGLDNQCPGDPGYGTVDEGCPMAFIPAGCFDMGDSSDGCAYSDGCPVHNVCLPSFYMDVYEVTNAAYKACVDASGCPAPISSISFSRSSYYGNPAYNNFPVIYVNWNHATAYCTWAGKRLPTEAEWEYAARGGQSGKRYPWGDSISPADASYGWNYLDSSEVGSFAANGYGLYDMSGNVWEWVNDWYLATYYTGRPNPDNDPPGPASGTVHVLRGGSWNWNVLYVRVAYRSGHPQPTNMPDDKGFRCAGD
jgi:formylglycine-generating enzyme required for sulfatase activity